MIFSCGIINSYGQRIIEYRGDTLIVVTPKTIATMNAIIVDREYLEEEVIVLSEMVTVKDSIILDQTKIIEVKEKSLLETKKYHDLQIHENAVTWKKQVWKWSGISAGVGVLLGFLISR